jgi:23S rRNA pseudouridine1911/1915/1917 synthase
VRPADIPEDAILRVLRVPAESAGMRVDVFVSTQLRNTSRTRAQLIVENGAYTAEGRRLDASDRVRAEEHVVLWRLPFEENTPVLPLPVLYEDPHLLVIDKPPMIAVHPTARYHKNTVIKRLNAERPGEWLSLVHRLDRETSGILLLARSPEADRSFKRLLEERSIAHAGGVADADGPDVKKTYLAITWGHPEAALIDAPLELDGDNPLRVKMRLAARGSGLEAKTRVFVQERIGRYALVACELLTGRQHQIRVHLASVGCPVVGDKLYGPDERMLARAADGELDEKDLTLLELPRHALHAHRYELPHAMTGEPLSLSAPLAADLTAFWQSRS